MRPRALFLACLCFACNEDEPSAGPQPHAIVNVNQEGTKVTQKLNRLAQEKSVYLRQHATNPVDWYPWGEEAFAKARRENKPLFLSIGYSSCHWCHVMEHESFADEEVAEVLNQHFVAVKVDREERPDVDEIYMRAAQLMGGGGGWPLSVWLTPDRKPFLSGTYFPKTAKMGMPGFLDILRSLAEAWADEAKRQQILARADRVAEVVQEVYDMEEPAPIGREALQDARASVDLAYDAVHGGLAGPPQHAPKFPSPSSLEMVLRWSLRHDDAAALKMVTHTLDRMARGGIHDHVGGGFHRYSVTRDWLVPHFEKMLYDNAQLLGLYAWAYLVTGQEGYAETARDIALWIRREMTHEQGGFYSAQDADDPGGPEGEGGFYVWDPEEVAALFDEQEAKVVRLWFDIGEKGNWVVNGRQEKPGKSLLQITRTADEVAREAGLEAAQVRAIIAKAKARMYEVREQRAKPITDEKVLTAWNALMISGLAKAYQALGDEALLESAVRAAGFVRANLVRDGRLLRRWADGEAAHGAVLDDHAYLIAAYLDLYESTFDQAWLAEALRLNALTLEHFHDAKEGGFFYTAADGEKLIARGKPGFDNARPSGNGVMAMNLLRIAELTGDLEARERAHKTLEYFGTRVTQAALGFGAVLNALDFAQNGTREIFVAGDPTDAATQALITAVWRNPDPNRVLALVTPGLERLLPPARGKTPVDGKPAAYVCRNFTCDAPTTDPADLRD
ncbi:MAG: thioredoxin domain-containing protein [Planctomycetota bacterium]|jgi:uncharacterized protein YyaL (SSP411 family)